MKNQLENNMAGEKMWLEVLENRRLLSADLAAICLMPIAEDNAAIDVPAEGSEEVVIEGSTEDILTVDDSEIVDVPAEEGEATVEDPNVIFYCFGGAVDPAVEETATDEGRGVDENGEIKPNFRGAVEEGTEVITDETGEIVDETTIDETLVDPIPEELLENEVIYTFGGVDPVPEVTTTEVSTEEVDPSLAWTCGFPDGEVVQDVTTTELPTEDIELIPSDTDATDDGIIFTTTDIEVVEDNPVIYYAGIPEGAVAKGEVTESAETTTETANAGPAPESSDQPAKVDSIFSELEIASDLDVLA